MKDPLYRFSAATVSLARRLEAGFYLGLVLVFGVMVLWLTLSFGLNWFVIGLDIFLGLCAAELFVKACTVYSTSQPPERPDERERYLQSRSLHIPGSRREARRRERGS
jgi:hypothetical protein